MSSKKRLLVIGLDGATWDIIDALLQSGRLPAMAGMAGTGTRAVLQSTVPSATFPSWTTFMTGKNPGGHGLFDFTELARGSYGIRFLNATFRRSETLFMMLSRAGLRVGAMGVPATYPPERVNGFMISGFDSPVAGSIDTSFVHPPELYRDIRSAVGEYRISDLLETYMTGQWYVRASEKIMTSLDKKARTALYLYRREPWDFFMVHFGESDTAAHHFWKFHDPASPRYEPAPGRLPHTIRDVYVKLDSIINDFLESLWEDTTVLIVSDHGFGGAGTRAVSLNRWLEGEGLLELSDRPALLDRGLELVKQAGLRHLHHGLQELVFRSPLRRIARRMETASRFRGIQWSGTAAFSEDMNHFPGIHINLQGREPQGTVAPGTDYERVRDEVIAGLRTWRDPETGRHIVRRAWRREEVYRGRYVERAPDIIIDLHEHDGYSCLCLPHGCFERGEPFRRLSRDELRGPRMMSMSGSHRGEGIFLCSESCPELREPPQRAPAMQDMCPSILSFFGVTPAEALDGRPVGLGEGPAARRAAGCTPEETGSEPRPYTRAQERKVADRLRRLGYFD